MVRTGFFLMLLAALLSAPCADAAYYGWPDREVWPESPRAEVYRRATSVMSPLATGAVSVDIPLYTLEVEGVKIPLTLRYRSNGIRVHDQNLPLGYGWVLTPPFRVTRHIMGRADGAYGFLSSTQFPDYLSLYRSVKERDDVSAYDTEHDIFTIHLIDRTLTAMLSDGKFITAAASEFRIESDEKLTYIRVTDPGGLVYMFSTAGEYIHAPAHSVEWLLTSLTLPSGDTVDFSWTAPRSYRFGQQRKVTNGSLFYSTQPDYTGGAITFSHTENFADFHNVREPAQIKFPGGSIDFSYKDDKLTDMNVKWDNKTVIRGMFEYEDSCGGMLLTSVAVTGSGRYRFEYDSTRFEYSGGIDFWGYYNGKNNTGELAPRLSLKPGGKSLVTIHGADRNPSATHMGANMLTKVRHPAGAIQQWEYEPHRFSPQTSGNEEAAYISSETALTFGGGLRVSRTMLYKDSTDTDPTVKEYVYGRGGNGLATVEAAPVASTFVTQTIVPYVTPSGLSYGYRIDSRMRSDYLDYRPGLVPLWYEQVTEKYPEGQVTSEFTYTCPSNTVDRSFGYLWPREITTAFSCGPLESRRAIYKESGGKMSVAEEIVREFQMTPVDNKAVSMAVRRNMTHMENTVDWPDFGTASSLEFSFSPGMTDNETITIRADEFFLNSPDVYERQPYTVLPITERCVRETSTMYGGGSYDIVRISRQSFVPGTGLLARKVVQGGEEGDSIVTTYSYDEAFSSDMRARLAAANIRSLPMTVTETRGGLSTTVSLEMQQVGKVFVPVRTWQRRGDGEMWHSGTTTYNAHGRPVSFTGTDGVRTTWAWDEYNRHQLSETIGTLTTSKTWKPLVGVESETGTTGLTKRYEYDDNMRLMSETVDKLGKLKDYSYRQRGDSANYVKLSVRSPFRGIRWEKTMYYDGLGNTDVVVQNPAGTPVVSLTEYDRMGRTWRQWTPTVMSDLGTVDKPDIEDIKTAVTGQYADTAPYSESTYEQSPRDMLTSVTNSGQAWHDAGKKSTVTVRGNTAAECYRYNVFGERYGVSQWPAGSLKVTETIDEDGITLIEYEDIRGHIVCRKRGGKSTYFVYDGYGDLRYMIPSGTQRKGQRTSESMQQLAYWYDYDERGRCILKKLPGIEAAEYRYDPGDRLVADKETKLGGRWRLHFYDNCGREVFQALATLTASEVEEFASAVRCASLSTAGTYAGYAFDKPVSFAMDVLTASYFDNHNFIDVLGLDKDIFCLPEQALEITPDSISVFESALKPSFKTSGTFNGISDIATADIPWTFFPSHSADATGLLTGVYTGAGHEAYYYNYLGNEIYRGATGYNAGRRFSHFDYRGMPVSSHSEYPAETGFKARHTKWKYDRYGRPVEQREYVAGGDSAIITYSYNELGQLTAKNYGWLKTESTYSYDIHGWLKKSQLKYFYGLNMGAAQKSSDNSFDIYRYDTEELLYTTGATPCYNGNISAKVRSEGRYDYTYNNLNQLTSAAWTPAAGKTDDFSTTYEYDARGNILHLTRRGIVDKALTQEIAGELDDLTMGYTGNRLTTVTATTEALPFEGRTGLAQTGTYNLTYDYAGNLKSDPSRGISSITYNHLGQPVKITFDNRNIHTYSRDNLGNVLSIKYEEVVTRPGTTTAYLSQFGEETFHGDGQRTRSRGIISTGKGPAPVMTTFQGGYFDAKGRPHYNVTDYQGNIVAVLDHRGAKVQSSSYYPYGELHRDCIESLDVDTTGMGLSRQSVAANSLLPGIGGGTGNWPGTLPLGSSMPVLSDATQPHHYSGKELMNIDGQREYDFHARRHNPLAPNFTTMDPKAESYPHLSPYSHCAANPIMLTDPTGENYTVFIDHEKKVMTVAAIYYVTVEDIGELWPGLNYWLGLSGKYYMDDYRIDFLLTPLLLYMNRYKDNKEAKKGLLPFYATLAWVANYFYIEMEIKRALCGTASGKGITLYNGFINVYTAAHEIGHTLGLVHQEGGIMSAMNTLLGRSSRITPEQIADIIRGAITGIPMSDQNGIPAGMGNLAPGTVIEGYEWTYKVKRHK